MNPSRIVDYMTEMNRLFPKNDIDRILARSHDSELSTWPMTPSSSSLSFTRSIIQSSSSTDTSPESDITASRFLDLHPERFYRNINQFPTRTPEPYYEPKPEIFDFKAEPYETFYENRKDQYMTHNVIDTPPSMRHRPIIGRKLMGPTDSKTPSTLSEISTTPPKSSTMYELFPSENHPFEVRTPVKSHSSSSLTSSPRMISPTYMHNITPPSRQSFMPRFREPMAIHSTYRQAAGAARMCTFCRKNGETPIVYMTHAVKEKVGNKNVVTCPILRSHVCSTCGASGDDAHTITYCPVLRSGNNGQPLQSTTITLKNTRVKSNGRRRY